MEKVYCSLVFTSIHCNSVVLCNLCKTLHRLPRKVLLTYCTDSGDEWPCCSASDTCRSCISGNSSPIFEDYLETEDTLLDPEKVKDNKNDKK